MIIKLVVLCIILTAPVSLWGALCALSAIDARTTRQGIALGFFFCVVGWGSLIAAGADYLLGPTPLFWPLAMLFGVLLLAVGNAAIFLANKRDCTCQACPGRGKRRAQGELRHG